jgi:ATP-binding cassette, subfamily B, bacterial
VEPRADTAFRKALEYLNYNATARWLAYLGGIGNALAILGLLMTLWLFTDLMVSRGRIPDFEELTPKQVKVFGDQWSALQEKWNDTERGGRAALEAAKDNPSSFNLDLIRKFADKPLDKLSSADANRLWAEQVRIYLQSRVGDPARAVVIRETDSGLEIDRGNHGVLSLVVREAASGRRYSPFPWLARWNHWMWNPTGNLYLSILFAIAAGLVVLAVLFVLLQREMASRATITATTRLRRGVYHHTFRLGTLAIRALGPTEAVSLLTRHIEALHDALYARLTSYFETPILVCLMLAFAILTDPLLSLAFLLFAVVVWRLGILVNAYAQRGAQQATDAAAQDLSTIRESLMLMRLVKCYLMEDFNSNRVERQLAQYARAQQQRLRSEAFPQPLLVLLGSLAALLLMFFGALGVFQGYLSVAGAVVLPTTLLCLYLPVKTYLADRKLIRRGQEAALLVFRFLERKGDVGQVVQPHFLEPLSKSVEFSKVTLRESGSNRPLLDEVSLTIPAGHRIGLVGADNLEKHAFVYLIPRLFDPTSGEVRIDDHNIRLVRLESLRNQIGIVMNHNLVFHDTVFTNIGCGDQFFQLPKVIEAAKMAHAHQFIQKLPQGYETVIGEQGHSLSPSEQFRIALARAILRDPALLIIEEPEAQLDEDTKSLLDDTLLRVLPGRTVIFLPHRISTLRSCHTLYVFNKGKIVASGTHKELLAGDSLYRHLHYLEFNEVEERLESAPVAS